MAVSQTYEVSKERSRELIEKDTMFLYIKSIALSTAYVCMVALVKTTENDVLIFFFFFFQFTYSGS